MVIFSGKVRLGQIPDRPLKPVPRASLWRTVSALSLQWWAVAIVEQLLAFAVSTRAFSLSLRAAVSMESLFSRAIFLISIFFVITGRLYFLDSSMTNFSSLSASGPLS